jgi:hypothetical protein
MMVGLELLSGWELERRLRRLLEGCVLCPPAHDGDDEADQQQHA